MNRFCSVCGRHKSSHDKWNPNHKFKLDTSKSLMLDIGCGSPDQKKEGYKGIDVYVPYKPDVLHDCNNGIPFKSGSVDAIWMDNSLEHFVNPSYIIEECHRVLKKGGILEIKLPNLQFFPVLFAMFFGDVQKLWNWWMNSKYKIGRSFHYTLWTHEVLRLQLVYYGFETLNRKGGLYSKELYVLAVKK